MNENPISKIRSNINFFEDRLREIASLFKIPSEVAEEVLSLDWESFRNATGDFIDESVWRDLQSQAASAGAIALSGFSFGTTKIEVGDEYAIWDGCAWIRRGDLPSA
jgi:hypothetical protein